VNSVTDLPSINPKSSGDAPEPVAIGILGHVGNKNLGDEAIIAAVIQNIRRRWVDARILGFTSNPNDTEQRHGIPSFPIRRGTAAKNPPSSPRDASSQDAPSSDSADQGGPSPRERLKNTLAEVPLLLSTARAVIQAVRVIAGLRQEVRFLLHCRNHVRGLDLLIIAGSHQLNDFVGGPWAFPYTILKWSILARRAGVKLAFLSVGAGPIDSRLGRLFLRRALRMAEYRSYRDETSLQVVETLQVPGKHHVVPDLAFSLDLPSVSVPAPGTGRSIVGINPLPFFDAEYWYESDPERYESYVANLATFSDWLLDRGCAVRFVPTQMKVDPGVIDDVRARMNVGEASENILVPEFNTLPELISVLSDSEFVVATRYHGILLGLALGKPVLAVAYHPKSRDLMNWLGLSEYVVDGNTFRSAELEERFSRLEENGPAITASLEQKVPQFRSALEAQYDEVFASIDKGKVPAASDGLR
jgi:polysaccharide pyruvyl transferase WcaK-like protein